MSKKIKRRGRAAHQASVPKASSTPPPAASGISAPSDALMEVIEKAADRVKNDLASTGKLRPTTFFIYSDGTMKTASLSYRDATQKDTQIGRVREKARAEQASAVLLFTGWELPGTALLSAVTRGENVCALVAYSLDGEAKKVTSWSVTWVDGHVHGSFLEDIFG